ncbi:metalloregulator ArsR/SmtB family transcription factor [Candidatus Thalassolituus haligoni]|uniref:metalloregulator ArsR/SmtB family transcription factor n=1 Tax=Candidatus Thalassolituus haligoni TaxID=3100113 RepID=UPI00351561C9|tara:strand:- start:477 stop:854 length:378 start_codon:yes stop_codon:yes gene_type:complete
MVAVFPPVELFKLLADPTRFAALMLIVNHKELCVCELTEALALSQPKVSRHLALLRTSGLLVGEKRGQWVYYRLQPMLDAAANAVLEQVAQLYAHDLAECEARLQVCIPTEQAPGCCAPRPGAQF